MGGRGSQPAQQREELNVVVGYRCDVIKKTRKGLSLLSEQKAGRKSNAKGENKEKPVCTLSRETHTMKVCMLRSLPLPPKLGLSRLAAPPPPPPPQHLHTFPFVWTGPSSLQSPSRMRCECTNKPPPLPPSFLQSARRERRKPPRRKCGKGLPRGFPPRRRKGTKGKKGL